MGSFFFGGREQLSPAIKNKCMNIKNFQKILRFFAKKLQKIIDFFGKKYYNVGKWSEMVEKWSKMEEVSRNDRKIPGKTRR